jgi:hypothetical protein
MTTTDIRTVELYAPRLADLPQAWEPADDEALPRLAEALRPDPATGLASPAQWASRQRLAAGRWFLLRNTHHWRSGRSGRSGAVEPYFTYAGIERPFSGIDDIHHLIREHLHIGEETARAMVGNWLKLGAIEPIEPERARWYALRILAKTGRNLYPQLVTYRPAIETGEQWQPYR